MSTELADLAALFKGFAEYSPSPLYARLSRETAENPDVTGLLLEAAPAQRWPMLLLAAVNLEVMRSREPYPQDGEQLATYCREHRETLLPTIRSHSTQTNEVGRCSYLLPCFAHAADGRPLAILEVGASAGLTMNWDRYGYDYGEGLKAGEPSSPVQLSCELRGRRPPMSTPPVIWRAGIDLSPRPDDDWLRACVMADQPERLERLDAALELAREHPPRLVQGNALELLPDLMGEAPPEAQLIVYHTAVLAYITPGDTQRLRTLGAEATYVTAEFEGVPQEFTLQVNGQTVGAGHAHGRWLNWAG